MNIYKIAALAIFVFAITIVAGCGGGSEIGAPQDEKLYQDIYTLLTDTSSQYKRLKEEKSTEDEARAALVEWLSAQALVKDAGLSEDGYTVWYNTTDGISMNIITYTDSYPMYDLSPKAVLSHDTLSPKALKYSSGVDSQSQFLFMFVPFFWEQTKACIEEGGDNEACSDVDNFPYTDLTGMKDLKKYYADPQTKQPLSVQSYIDKDATVESMESILTSALLGAHIFIQTHGGIAKRDGKDFGFLLTSEGVAYDQTFLNRVQDLKAGKFYISTYADKHYYAITPKFITDFFKGLQISTGDFHVFVLACKSFNESMINAFMTSGARSYIGYTGLASHQFGYDSLISIYSNLMKGMSVSDAVESALPSKDPLNLLTFVRAESASPDEAYFNRIFLNIGEAEYETPAVQNISVMEDAIGGILTTKPAEGEWVGNAIGAIAITLPALQEGEYDITATTAGVVVEDNTSGMQWVANKECRESNPLCSCSGTVTIEKVTDRYIKGSFDVNAADSGNVTTTQSITGTFRAAR